MIPITKMSSNADFKSETESIGLKFDSLKLHIFERLIELREERREEIEKEVK